MGRTPRARTFVAATAVLLASALARPAAADDAVDDSASDEEVDEERDVPPGAPAPVALGLVVGPPIGEVLAAAYAAAGLEHQPAPSWRRRARLAGLVPLVSVRTGRNVSWQDVADDVDHGVVFEVRASWRLDRLVFDGRELQASTIETARRRERRRLATRVIRLYFAWARAAEAALARPTWRLRAAELAAELDALTDGAFMREVALSSARGGPSDRRTALPR